MKTGIGAAFLALLLAACSAEPAVTLPDGCYGEWEHLGTSGGIDGRDEAAPKEKRARVTITRDGEMVTRMPDGRTTTRRFTVRRGPSIFSTGEAWLLTFEDSDMDQVVELAADGATLTLSENVYDGFTYAYRRVGEDAGK